MGKNCLRSLFDWFSKHCVKIFLHPNLKMTQALKTRWVPIISIPVDVPIYAIFFYIFRLLLGRDFRWSPSEASEQYLDILPLFADDRSALFGIHQLSMVSSEDRPVGTWFGPNAVAQAIKKMVQFDPQQRLNVQVAMNNVLILSDFPLTNWRPLLLFLPVRLGINEINPTYFNSLKTCFELEQCVGVIGGRPNHALFYVGYRYEKICETFSQKNSDQFLKKWLFFCSCDDLICLDPHVTQDSVNVGTKSCPDEEEADSTYHTELFYRWHMDQLDPSIALVSITKIKTFSRC